MAADDLSSEVRRALLRTEVEEPERSPGNENAGQDRRRRRIWRTATMTATRPTSCAGLRAMTRPPGGVSLLTCAAYIHAASSLPEWPPGTDS